MTLVAPVNLPFNIKTLWFDPQGIDIHADDKLVVKTARGLELGVAASAPIEVDYEEITRLKSPLAPVLRIATEEDLAQAHEMERRSREAMPIFRELARETSEEMHPVSVEYMLDGDKAIFYFESEKRIDFRDMVRKLASVFHVRIDMHQIGIRDEARIVGGIAHCGQVVCCKRLGGEFKPVSIRMAKDQDLSLNSEKISGLCGRLMCCLRYEDEVYKEFKSHAPKIGAHMQTPDGEGRVVELDIPREMVMIKIGEDKPIKVPESAVYDLSEDRKFGSVEADAWNNAVEAAHMAIYGTNQLIDIPLFTGEDKLGTPEAVHNKISDEDKRASVVSARDEKSSSGTSSRISRKRSSSRNSKSSADASKSDSKRTPRRRSTKLDSSSGEKKTTTTSDGSTKKTSDSSKGRSLKDRSGKDRPSKNGFAKNSQKKKSDSSQKSNSGAQKPSVRPGQKSSSLSHHNAGSSKGASEKKAPQDPEAKSGNKRRRRRKSHKVKSADGSSGAPDNSAAQGASGTSGTSGA